VILISNKECSEHSAAVKEDELWKDGKKIVKNTLINLYYINYFYCNKKIAKN